MTLRKRLSAFVKLGCAVTLFSSAAFADAQVRCHWNSDRAGDFMLNTYPGSANLVVDIYTTDFAALGLNVPASAYYARLFISPVTLTSEPTDPYQQNFTAPSHLVEFLDGGERSLGFQDNFKFDVQLRSAHQGDSVSYQLDIVRDAKRKSNTAFQYQLGTQADQATCSAEILSKR